IDGRGRLLWLALQHAVLVENLLHSLPDPRHQVLEHPAVRKPRVVLLPDRLRGRAARAPRESQRNDQRKKPGKSFEWSHSKPRSDDVDASQVPVLRSRMTRTGLP